MKIAFLSTFYPFRGGIAQFNASLYRAMEERHPVRAFTFSRQYPGIFFPGETQYVTESDKVDPVPAEQLLDSINPITYWKTAAAIRHFQPKLLLMKFWLPFFAPSLGTVAGRLRKAGTRVVSVLDNIIPHEKRPGDMHLIRFFLNRNDGFVVMSKTVERDLLCLKPGAKRILKPHPIYEHFGKPVPVELARKKLGLPQDKKILLFFGFIREYKGLDNAIRAMAYLPEDYLLVIAGEVYGDFENYDRLIGETGVGNKIRSFVRYIDDHEVALFFSAANVALLPYKSATQSGITQIAFNFNLPAIVTDVGGLSEIVEDSVTGLVLQTQKPRELAEKIQYYFRHQLQMVFSQTIDKRRKQLSWAGFAEAILQFYETL